MATVVASLFNMAERRYDERDVAEILRDAAENQTSRLERGQRETGMTLSEIQRLASEVGIDADQVAAAAGRRENRREKPETGGFWGAANQVTRTRISEGVLDDSAWEEVVDELRSALGGPGTLGTVGASREWTGGNGFVSAHFTAKPQDGTTRFRISLDQSALFARWMFTFVFLVVGSAAGCAIMAKAGIAPFAIWAALIAFVSLACFATNRSAARWQKRNIRLANSLLERAETLVPEAAPEVQQVALGNLANPPTVRDGQSQTSSTVTP